jgi:hypothetical protein
MCKWIDAARLSMIGRALNSSRYGERGFCLKFADSSSRAESSTSCKLLRSAGTRVEAWTLKVEELYSASDVTTLVRAARPTSLVLFVSSESLEEDVLLILEKRPRTER